MSCPFGRIFDPSHRTCRSHVRQVGSCKVPAKKKTRGRYSGGPFIREGRRGWSSTYDLQSLNKHMQQSGGDSIYRGIKRTWGMVLANAAYHFGLADGRRRRVAIVRYIPSRAWSYDEDNLWGACKPVVDVLVKQGILVDDSQKWLERVPPVEVIDPVHRVEIFIEEVFCEEPLPCVREAGPKGEAP